MSAKIHKLKAVDNDKYTSLISKISKHLTENLTDLVTNMFNGADDALFRLAELAESNEEQTHYFDAMRMLRLERDNIGASFTLEVDNLLKPDGSSKTDGSDTEFDDKELALVDQDTMEEMVAISAMHSKAMNLFGQEISHLEARLDYLAIKTKRIFNEESFQPKNFCSAFQASLNPVELSIKNKLILYKLFDQEVISQMQPCYVAINNILIAENILPQIKLGSISAKPVGANSSVNNNFRNSETVESCNSSEPFSDAPYFPIDNDSMSDTLV